MRITEIDQPGVNTDPNKLVGLAKFLSGRAEDTNAQKQISQDAFMSAAQSLGIMLTPDNLADVIAKPPLNGVLEPLDPNSDMISFKGADIGAAKMSVPQAQQVVNKMAKSAMKRPM
jgi:hypothetical protein